MTTSIGAQPHPILLAGRWVDSPDAINFHPIFHTRAHDRTDGRIHAWGIAPAGHHRNAFHELMLPNVQPSLRNFVF